MKAYTISTTAKNVTSTSIEDNISENMEVKAIKFSYNTTSATSQNPKIDIAVNNIKITEKPVYPVVFDFFKNDKTLFVLNQNDDVSIKVTGLDGSIEQQIDITFIGV